jgi:hypothetical protein
MAIQTVTLTEPAPTYQQPESPPPESYELSLKTPGRTLKEISRRVANASKRRDSSSDEEDDDIRNDVPPPATAQSVVQAWNDPKGNIPRCGFAFFSFIIAGMNDAAVGVGDRCPRSRLSFKTDLARLSFHLFKNTTISTTPLSR